MNFFGIGLPEMALILVLALLVFGPKKLPEVGSSLAKALKSFQKAQQDFESEFKKEAEQIQKSVTEPMKASLEKPEPKALAPQKSEQNGTAAVASESDGAEVEDSAHSAPGAEPESAGEAVVADPEVSEDSAST
jgi:sec-independent protein translocase protein TatA